MSASSPVSQSAVGTKTPGDATSVDRLRVDLACALRWAARYGLHEGVCNHFSVALPGRNDRFLLNPQGMHWDEITPDDLLVVDTDGKVLEGRGSAEPTAFYIHSRIHHAKPSARCVMHTHMPYATTLTVVEGARVEWISQNSLRYYHRIAYEDEYNGLALDSAEGDRLCGRLANADVVFLANHGVIVTGPDVAMAFDDLYYLERTCMLQVMALSTGKPLRPVPPHVALQTARQLVDCSQQARLHLDALTRLLDRDAPAWRRA